MSKTYLLIDLQNRHPAPEDVASWMGANGEAWIFYGEHEIGLLAPYMELGDRVSLVDISRPGKNSLDFHLVLYLGYLVGRHEPGARFVIVAADGDYDPAIVHARSKGQRVERVEDLGPAPAQVRSLSARQGPSLPSKIATDSQVVESARSATRNKKSKSVEQIYLEILKDFKDAGKPKTLTSLEKRIQWRLGPEPAPEKVAEVLAALEREGEIKIAEGTIEYRDHVALN
ncbi:NYN domain-containing protein [Variovorax atrisoli]|uniref:PIN domain-containing protein n=1 Tax=Variovorax atrisoli TaxID=3394203 RepID=UPI000F7F5A7B|nr:PIN domain-containing protein [Variovorax sp. 369]RTD84987.1 NYN domain-containing protein [Variovorax sp. 369]